MSGEGDGAERATAPVRIGRRDPARLVFEWADGQTTEAPAAIIRRHRSPAPATVAPVRALISA